jgi:hypothetical protein
MNENTDSKPTGRGVSLSEGDHPYTIHAALTRVGDDLLCVVTGGTRPHIGAICLAEPADAVHPISGNVRGQADIQNDMPIMRTLSGDGHKEGLPAEMFAKELCACYGVNVVCTAGIHVDDASQEEIGKMMENAARLLSRLLAAEI